MEDLIKQIVTAAEKGLLGLPMAVSPEFVPRSSETSRDAGVKIRLYVPSGDTAADQEVSQNLMKLPEKLLTEWVMVQAEIPPARRKMFRVEAKLQTKFFANIYLPSK